VSVEDMCQTMKFLIFFFKKNIIFFEKIIFFFKKFKNCHVLVYHRVTWQFTIMTRGGDNSFFSI